MYKFETLRRAVVTRSAVAWSNGRAATLDQIVDLRSHPTRAEASSHAGAEVTVSVVTVCFNSGRTIGHTLQLLRGADWASVAAGVEVRGPLVDNELLHSLSPAIAGKAPGEGKAALANAPRVPLPDWVLKCTRTEFGVPTAHWMAAASADTPAAHDFDAPAGATSRRWSKLIIGALAMPVGWDA